MPQTTPGDTHPSTDESTMTNPTDIELNMFVGDVLDILSNRRRREAILILADLGKDEKIKPERLAERIYASIHDMDFEEVDSTDAKSVYVGLHQRHIDQLRDARLAFEFPDGSVSGTERTRKVADLLRLIYHATEAETPPDELREL